MHSKEWAREMALYNKWQNETLYGHCGALSDETRRSDRGMFFGSIHNTLDHILMVDHALLDFIENGLPENFVFDPNKSVHQDYQTLTSAREAFDQRLLELIEERADDWLDTTIAFESQQLGRTRILPRKFYCMQLFNHGTHHRSQVTSELHKLGVDYGNTDLPYNPYSQY